MKEICVNCENEGEQKYCGHPLCYSCFIKQMCISTFNKDLEELTESETEELEDICFNYLEIYIN